MNGPAMLTLCGQVVHVFTKPGGSTRDGERKWEDKPSVQLLASMPLKNGETQLDLVTMSTDVPHEYQALKGRSVRVPVGVYVSNGKAGFYALQGQPPEEVPSA